jgi:hypothetical protein
VRKTIIVGAVVLASVIAGVVYLSDHSAKQSPATLQSDSGEGAGAESGTPGVGAQLHSEPEGDAALQPMRSASKSVPADPRLAALAVSPDNGLIEFVAGSDGKVIKEIDKDPGSLGFKRPLREYTYSGDKVIGLTSYRYFGDHVEVTRTAVSYKPDGSVDQYLESTSYEKKAKGD